MVSLLTDQEPFGEQDYMTMFLYFGDIKEELEKVPKELKGSATL